MTDAAGLAVTGGTAPAWCDRCGDSAAAGPHDACAAARALEPPRFCARCRRRMKVQVLPVGWSAVCVEHGEIRG
ncbi:biotin synthase auxiliary protein BsaP [Micromonospora sp. LZ34]